MVTDWPLPLFCKLFIGRLEHIVRSLSPRCHPNRLAIPHRHRPTISRRHSTWIAKNVNVVLDLPHSVVYLPLKNLETKDEREKKCRGFLLDHRAYCCSLCVILKLVIQRMVYFCPKNDRFYRPSLKLKKQEMELAWFTGSGRAPAPEPEPELDLK